MPPRPAAARCSCKPPRLAPPQPQPFPPPRTLPRLRTIYRVCRCVLGDSCRFYYWYISARRFLGNVLDSLAPFFFTARTVSTPDHLFSDGYSPDRASLRTAGNCWARDPPLCLQNSQNNMEQGLQQQPFGRHPAVGSGATRRCYSSYCRYPWLPQQCPPTVDGCPCALSSFGSLQPHNRPFRASGPHSRPFEQSRRL